MGVFVASFAATTLDTACRLQRYVIQELAATLYKNKPTVAPETRHSPSAPIHSHGLPTGTAQPSLPSSSPSGLPQARDPRDQDPAGSTSGRFSAQPINCLAGWLFWSSCSGCVGETCLSGSSPSPPVFMLLLPGLAMSIELFKPGGWIANGKLLLSLHRACHPCPRRSG